MVAHSRSVVVISCTMGISAGTTHSSALGKTQSPAAPRCWWGGQAAPSPRTYPLRSTTAPFRWISEAGKMPWGGSSHQHPRAGAG